MASHSFKEEERRPDIAEFQVLASAFHCEKPLAESGDCPNALPSKKKKRTDWVSPESLQMELRARALRSGVLRNFDDVGRAKSKSLKVFRLSTVRFAAADKIHRLA